MLKRVVTLAALSAGLASGAIGLAHAAPVSVSYYYNFTDTGTDITVSGSPFRTDSIASINSSADPNFPGAGFSYAGIFTSNIDVSSTGFYSFTLGSDDGSYLFIDGSNVISNGGSHSYNTVGGLDFLTAGEHSVRVDYDNTFCCGAAVDLTLASGTSYVSGVPLPATLPMFGVALLGLGAIGYGLKRSGNAAA